PSLADPTARNESRAIAVGRMTRSLKQLARASEAAVLVLSQLNRECESRDDKKPRLSDLKECVVGDAVVLDAVTGEPWTIRELAQRAVASRVYALREDWRMGSVPRAMAWSAGRKPVFRVGTRTGRVIRCTARHRFRTI